MILIGEKLNSSIPKTLAAMQSKDDEAIRALIKAQADAGAEYLDINCAMLGEEEKSELIRIGKMVCDETDFGLMLDSPDPEVLLAALSEFQGKKVILNSVTPDEKCLPLIRAAAKANAGVVAMPVSSSAMPSSPEERIAVFEPLIALLESEGIAPENIYADIVVQAVAMQDQAGLAALDTLSALRARFPDIRTVCGLSNISFGLPGRGKINAAFLALALSRGLDAAILDAAAPAVRDLMPVCRMLLGEDEYCMDYIEYFTSAE